MAVVQLTVVQTELEHCDAVAALESVVFPTLSPDEWFTGEMYRTHVATFPEGQFVVLADAGDGARVVGATTTFRTNETFEDDYPPYYFDFIGRGYLTTHDPHGAWLYGTGLMVHPEFRRMGVGTRLYEARRALVRRFNLRGELVTGLLPGYEKHRHTMSVEDYARRVAAGELTDPTLTMQLRAGFTLRRVLPGYIDDPRSDNTASLIVRENPDYRP